MQKKFKKDKVKAIYIDHAIVKVSTNDFGTNPDVRSESLLQHPTYNASHTGASVSIKGGAKLSIGSPEHHSKKKKSCDDRK